MRTRHMTCVRTLHAHIIANTCLPRGICKYTCTGRSQHACNYICLVQDLNCTAILIILEGLFQVFQRFSSSKLVRKAVENCFVALNYYENGSKLENYQTTQIQTSGQIWIKFKFHHHNFERLSREGEVPSDSDSKLKKRYFRNKTSTYSFLHSPVDTSGICLYIYVYIYIYIYIYAHIHIYMLAGWCFTNY